MAGNDGEDEPDALHEKRAKIATASEIVERNLRLLYFVAYRYPTVPATPIVGGLIAGEIW
ncbi:MULTISPECIES: hypothetical protein [unclassified Bradyrhizobium]